MNRTIVIADTDIVLLELLRSRCLMLGLRVETATRGEDAVRLIRRLQPLLACVHNRLTCPDGRPVCTALTEDARTRSVPLVVLFNDSAEPADRACRDLSAYVLPRSGNIWHRLEPLIWECLEDADLAAAQSVVDARDESDRAACSEPEHLPSRRARDWRIDEPALPPAQARSTGVGTTLRATPPRDARDSVLEMVFAWFAHTKDSVAATAASDASPAGLHGPHRRGSAEPPWVLCIEDDADFSLALKLRLEAHGVAVVRAFDGRSGYRAAFTHPASAILLDYNLPQGQGDYVLRRLKENPVTADVPVIVVTGIRSSATRRQMLALGADAYLIKPLDFDELVDVLGEYVEILPREYAAASY